MSLGICAISTSQFLPAGLLPLIADDLHVTVGAAGQTFTASAAPAALSALLVSVVLPGSDRRRVVMGLTLLALASDVLVALAPSLTVLLTGRLLLGVALGGFWAMAIAVTAQLVAPDRLGRTLTVVNAGVPVATGLAVPLGAWLGETWGWRAVFVVGAGVAAVALLLQAMTLPPVPAGPASGFRGLGSTLRSRVVLLGLLGTLLVYAGHFSGFTYVRPAAESLAGIDSAGTVILLLVFGCASLPGTVLAGPLADRSPRVGVLLFPTAAGLGMLVMLALGGSVGALFAAAALWGFGFGGMATSLQTWGARAEPARLEQIGGLLVTVANVSVAVGAVAGGMLVDRASSAASPLLGGLAVVAGALVLARLHPRS